MNRCRRAIPALGVGLQLLWVLSPSAGQARAVPHVGAPQAVAPQLPTTPVPSIINASPPSEVSTKLAPVLADGLGTQLKARLAQFRTVQDGWRKDWQTKKLSSDQLRDYRYFSYRTVISAVAHTREAGSADVADVMIPFVSEAVDWADLYEDPRVGVDLFTQALPTIRGFQFVFEADAIPLVHKVASLVEKLPASSRTQKAMMNMMLAMSGMAGLKMLNVDVIDVSAHAAYQALKTNGEGLPVLPPEMDQAMGGILTLMAVFVNGPDRVILSKFAHEHAPANVNLFDGSPPYIKAVDAALAGQWRDVDHYLSGSFNGASLLGMPFPTAKEGDATAGFMSLIVSAPMVQGEAAAVKEMIGDHESATALFERSRSSALLVVPAAADAVTSEQRLMAGGETVVQVAGGWMGTFAVVSRPGGGKVQHNVAFSPEAGGFSIVSNYLHLDPAQQLIPGGGILAAYSLMRRVPRRGPVPALDGYVDDLNRRAEALVGGTIRKALADAGAKPGERIVIILPAAFAMLPVAGAHLPGEQSLAERYEVRFALSLAHAVETLPTPMTSSPRIAFLSSSASGLASTALEQATVAPALSVTDAKSGADALGRMDGFDYWQIASHGTSDWSDPDKNGISLNAGVLMRASDIRMAHPKHPPRIVFLSACETAILDVRQDINRYDSLQTAFAALGAKAVIGTLWPVGDTAAALITARFHDLLVKDHLRPAAALRAAQQWIREGTAQDFRSFIGRRIADGSVRAADAEGATADLADRSSTERPFAHPFYWSSFQLLGG